MDVAAFSNVPKYGKAAHCCIVSECGGRWAVTPSVSEIESAEPRVKN
jgi:hypothetical protein